MSAVNWLVDRMHVSLSDEAIEDDIRGRAVGKDIPPEKVDKFVAEAIARHHENQEDYRKVMG